MGINLLQKEYEQKITASDFTTIPSIKDVLLQLEVTNICNHNCIFCPNHDSTRKRQVMDKELAIRVIKECADMGVKKICYHMNGESLVCAYLPDIIKLSKDMGYEYTFITTNGSLATDDLLKEMFDNGLDSIKFSINGGNRESYEKTHGKDDFDKAINALKFSYNYRKKTGKNYRIFVSYVITVDTVGQAEEFYINSKKYADDILFYNVCGYAGQAVDMAKQLYAEMPNKALPVFDITHTAPCAVLNNSINVTCEGYLSICCSEANNLMIIEDLQQKSVEQAWLGERMTELRKKHIDGDIKDTPCYGCITNTQNKVMPINEMLYTLSKSK